MKNIELLAPAGDFEKLKTALYFGADAVYAGGRNLSLRAFTGFSDEEMERAVTLSVPLTAEAHIGHSWAEAH